ncbi:hypothetical protein A1O7_01710 [Cladophialophora yegresii CBS 114405]|uniref:Major facilitator superfamily (MFS) profile domain-containing protein n=1 Tax=Cladophialophora yegresii CBS 114405 TaxID=1182544 RepID=W9X4K2_9EURO|nr:uncharacterized protein A1O7_01710 [Cladophialophora yegresii CBS 114405]EXJ65369.1 hypothetical protein A1O7_01710 [Cladophialophora yegresii CBS 114405]
MPTLNSAEKEVKPMAPSPSDESGTLDANEAQSENALVRKLDLYLVPLIIISYILIFLDRSNLGNAKIAGMPQDLHLHGNEINWAVSIFYATFIFFEIPITLLVKPLGPSKLISCILLSTSLVTTFSGFMSNAGSLIACRILLGVTEAASFAVLNYYVSLFWKREEIAKRAAAVYIAVTLSGAFGGLFAWALTQIDSVPAYAGWRWIFFVEGAISFCWACASFFLFPNSPETARFLNTEEKRLAQCRIESQDKDVPFRWSQVVAALKSPICWLSGFIQLCAGVYYHPLSIFLPTILTGLGYGTLQTQYLTIPVYLFATVMVFLFAWLADRTQRRAPLMLFFSLFTVAGYAILLAWEVPAGVKYFACFLILGFGNVLLLLNVAWLNGNIGPRYKRATALAFNQTISNIGSIIGGQIILDREGPRYRTGQAVAISCCGLACIGVMSLWWLLRSKNTRREKIVQEGKEDVEVGDESVHFRYQL